MTNPCIICVAITGSVPTKANNPAVPITVTEQIESCTIMPGQWVSIPSFSRAKRSGSDVGLPSSSRTWQWATVIGCRFLGATPREVGRDIGLATVSSLLMISVAIAFAYAVTAATGTSTSQTFLAYSPGGLTEMSLLAFAMGQDIAYVTTAHIIRITAVILLAAPVFHLIRRR